MSLPAAQVLLVGDDPQQPKLLAELLRDSNVSVLHATTAADAFRMMRDALVDLVLVDLVLPDVNGFDLLAELKASPGLQGTPVIVLTAWNGLDDRLRGFELGAADYLTKPFEPAELRARIGAVLRGARLQRDLVQVNCELTATRVSAEKAARAKAEFIAHVSHEVRTPLNGMIGMLGLLLETPLSQEQRGCVETINASSCVLLEILNDLLDFARIDAGKLELERAPLNLRLVVEEALDLVAANANGKKLDLAYQVDDAVPVALLGDVTRVRQVLVNLLGNAVKFTECGEVETQVTVLSRPKPGSADPFWQLHFSVRDTGIGISADQLAKLFHPFSQAEVSTARLFGGTGLGLVISKRLVELMGGKLWVESSPGKGSTFHFTLSFSPGPTAASSVGEVEHARLANLRLLIVDDNPTNTRILCLQATKWGMMARGTQSAQQALAWLRDGEEFDLAILDMQMPGMDGLRLAAEIRTLPRHAALPLILLTSMGVQADHPELAAAACISCLTKPVKPTQLLELLVRVVSGPKSAPLPTTATADFDQPLAARLPLRVLVCEDNAISQKVAIRLLQQLGYQPDLASNGREALARLDAQAYDFIFMDLLMPELGGLAATREIRCRQQDAARHPNYGSPIAIVAMTACAMPGDREKCLDAGMDDYLAKPVRLENVRAVIERWGSPPASGEAGDEPAKGTPTVVPEETSVPAPPPVDLVRFRELTDGTEPGFQELVSFYLEQTTLQMDQLADAVQRGQAQEVRRIAHSCAGASATCGIVGLVPLLRELERLGGEQNLTDADALYAAAVCEYARLRTFLAPYCRLAPELSAQA